MYSNEIQTKQKLSFGYILRTSASPSITLMTMNNSLLAFAINGDKSVPTAVIKLPNPNTHLPPYRPAIKPANGCENAYP